jgi:hypothetical protein
MKQRSRLHAVYVAHVQVTASLDACKLVYITHVFRVSFFFFSFISPLSRRELA